MDPNQQPNQDQPGNSSPSEAPVAPPTPSVPTPPPVASPQPTPDMGSQPAPAPGARSKLTAGLANRTRKLGLIAIVIVAVIFVGLIIALAVSKK